MKIAKTKPNKGPTAMQMVNKMKSVEMKPTKSKKQCITTKTKTVKEKKKEIRKGEQDDFLLFLKVEEENNNKK